MKLKKMLSAITMSAVLSISALPLSAATMTAYAGTGEGFGYTTEQLEASKLKPTLSVSKTTLSAADAKASPVQTVTISLKGADKQYCSTGFHVYFDKRLTLVQTQKGADATKGEAIEALAGESYSKSNCLFLTTAGKPNQGQDGVMWTFQLKLPADAADGDVYPIELKYEKSEQAEDVFINDIQNAESQLMQAWLFTNGLEDGYIRIGDKTDVSDVKKAGDANCDNAIDLADAVLIMQYIANPDKYGLDGTVETHMTSTGYANSDVSGNGDGVTSKDALAIQKYTLKILTSLPEK